MAITGEGGERVWMNEDSLMAYRRPSLALVPYLPASHVEALQARIEALEGALRAADIAIEHASRFPRSFHGIIGEAKLTAYRNSARSLAPSEPTEEGK